MGNFEDYILTENTNSSRKKYSCLFEVIRDNGQGYTKEIERFTLPLDDSNYNIDINGKSFVCCIG